MSEYLDFEISYDVIEPGIALLHLDVHRWSHTVARDMERAGDLLQDILLEEGVSVAYAVGAVHPRFCLYMGAEFVGTHEVDGTTYEVYKWVL